MIIVTSIKECEICGAVVYFEMTVDEVFGIPSGQPDKHAEWHAKRGDS